MPRLNDNLKRTRVSLFFDEILWNRIKKLAKANHKSASQFLEMYSRALVASYEIPLDEIDPRLREQVKKNREPLEIIKSENLEKLAHEINTKKNEA